MDEALKYGFRRVTPMDDCSDQFQGITYLDHKTLSTANTIALNIFHFNHVILYFGAKK